MFNLRFLLTVSVFILASVVSAQAQPSWCSGNCGGSSPAWTLYKFYRYPNGFLQQSVSSYNTIEACRAAGDRDDTPYPVVGGLCSYFNDTQPSVRWGETK